MKSLKFIISLYLLSNVCPLLTKYGTEVLTTNYAIFESKDFDDNEEMHFKIQSHEYNFYENYEYSPYNVEYNYFSGANVDVNSIGYPHHEYFKKTTYEDGNYKTKYFTIKKKRSEYSNTNGNYLYIEFRNLHVSSVEKATITNTKEDEGKLETWEIVVIVVVIVAIIAGIIIFCVCRRMRMKRAQQAAMATNVAVMNAQNQAAAIHAQNQAAAYNYAAQNAAYQAAAVENAQNAAYAAGVEDAQNAMLAQKNYQDQVYQGRNQNYQAQPYQNNNYGSSPIGGAPDTGYNSNAVM